MVIQYISMYLNGGLVVDLFNNICFDIGSPFKLKLHLLNYNNLKNV